MSTATADGILPTRSDGSVSDGLALLAFHWTIVALDAAILTVAAVSRGLHVGGDLKSFVVFGLLVAVAGSFTVTTGSASLGFDMPLLLAAGFLFGPLAAGMIALLAVFDVREFKREVPLHLSLFNRAEISLSVMAGTAVFYWVAVGLNHWPWTAGVAILALVVDVAVNYGLVATHWMLKSGRPFAEIVAGMRFGPFSSFVPLYAGFGFMGVLIAETHGRLGLAGVVAFVIPVLVARQAFLHRTRLEEVLKALESRTRDLFDVDLRIVEERRSERLFLAGELHDEVLPPLYNVNLMGEVLKKDLATGRFLELNADLGQMLSASGSAQDVVRNLVRHLRGQSGVHRVAVRSLQDLASELQATGTAEFRLFIEEFAASDDAKVLAYQVAREAMTNASRYAHAKKIDVLLEAREGYLRVVVADDGIGFDPKTIDRQSHFGLLLVVERVQSAGGCIAVDSHPGMGTLVSAAMPVDLSMTSRERRPG